MLSSFTPIQPRRSRQNGRSGSILHPAPRLAKRCVDRACRWHTSVLYTSGAEPDWPDALDPYTGTFTYFGDNRSPGRELHDTPKKGNRLLRRAFESVHAGREGRKQVPPFFLFDKPGTGRDIRFRGLLAPGSDRLSGEEDLVAVWRTTEGHRFQNYRAQFTVLNVASIPRDWIRQLASGEILGRDNPT